MQAVVEHVTSHSITETIEEVGANGDGGHIEPRLVVYQVSKLMERELFRTLWLQAFLGQKTASQGHHGCHDTEHGTDDGILMSSCSAHHLLEIWEREQSGKTHRVCSHHTERRELVFLVVVISHHTEQRTVWHIHHRIDCHHQQIEGVSIDALAHRTEVWGIEQEGENQSERYGSIDEPRTIGSEATLGAVGKTTHQRVCDDIEHTGDEHQHGGIGE